jgi:deoxycytidine triphosphate deaminase
MSFITIASGTLTTANPGGKGFPIYFAPLRKDNEDMLPTTWLDLHIGGKDYQECEKDEITRKFNKIAIKEKGGEVKRYVTISPRKAVRLWTEEVIGTDERHTAIFTNIASRAKHGLLVTPGKMDPGWCPTPLLLVVSNQSARPIRLYVGEKIAAIAFAKIDADAKPSKSIGNACGDAYPDYEIGKVERLSDWLEYRDYRYDLIKYLLFPALIFLFTVALSRQGYLPPSLFIKEANPPTVNQITK